MDSGDKNTVIVRLINNEDKNIELDVSLIKPENWRTFYISTLTIKENSTIILPISIISNLSTSPGSYEFYINLSNDNINYQKKIMLTTSVLKKIDIAVDLVSAPKISLAGKEVQANFEIQNNGNSRRRVHLSSINGSINGSRNLILDIGESKIVNVYSETDDTIIKNTKATIDIIVSSGPYRTTKSTSVTILSARRYRSSRYFQLPTEISAMYLYKDLGESNTPAFKVIFLVEEA